MYIYDHFCGWAVAVYTYVTNDEDYDESWCLNSRALLKSLSQAAEDLEIRRSRSAILPTGPPGAAKLNDCAPHGCFILFPAKKPAYLIYLHIWSIYMVHLMQCLLGRSGAFKIGNVVPCRWSVLASVTVVSLRCVRSLQDLNGSHRCVRRISTCPCNMLHALEDQALEPCQRSRTALVCLSNSAEGSAEQWIYVKLEKVTGKIGGSRFH